MKNNRLMWGLTILTVVVTIALSLGTIDSYSQKDTSKDQEQTSFEEMTKHIPIVDYDAPDQMNALEREQRSIKNKRYDHILDVFKNSSSGYEYEYAITSDAEPVPPLIPFAESRLVIIGKTMTATAFLSNEKKGIYTEFSLNIETVLKKDEKEDLKIGETITMDRAGGIVRYPDGHKMLYANDWQRMPETNQRYILFLDKDDDKNPNYKLITGYKLENGKVTALDEPDAFGKYNGMSEKEFISLVVDKKTVR